MAEGIYIDSDGTKLRVDQDIWGDKWYFNSEGQRHRLDGPAVEWMNGSRLWYQNGKWHRLDGPAAEWAVGDKYWYVEDKRVEPLFLVAYWLKKGRCCWFDEEVQELRFGDQ